ncbi:MAG: RnfABCDGE type electron transport complex subunit G [Acidobacteriota bacterium]
MNGVQRPSPIRLIATLGLAGFFSGVILVTVYLATQPIIQRNQAEALEAAIYRVVPGAVSRKAFAVRDGRLVEISEDEAMRAGGDVVYGAYDENGNLVGYAIPGEGPGFQDTIRLIYGYDPRTRKVVGMEVLESRETPGLGDKILKDEHFLQNFKELSVEPEVVAVKSGTKTQPNEVDSISGATISSKAVVAIINRSNQKFLSVLDGSVEGAATAEGGTRND